MGKELQSKDDIVSSVMALRKELLDKDSSNQSDVNTREIVFKLNSCLFSNYPTNNGGVA